MDKVETTKLSSREQVVIPEAIRNQMDLHTGDQFVVFAEKDIVILKMITLPDSNEFNQLISKARKAAQKVGLSERDIEKAFRDARKK